MDSGAGAVLHCMTLGARWGLYLPVFAKGFGGLEQVLSVAPKQWPEEVCIRAAAAHQRRRLEPRCADPLRVEIGIINNLSMVAEEDAQGQSGLRRLEL